MKKCNENNGITLIALVVTIIVLLVLAGISISMLTGQNGILNRAQEAKKNTEIAQEDENKKMQGYEDIINKYRELPKNEETTPYLPNSTFLYKEGDLTTGLVIKDSDNNEYVWIEVPTTIYDNATYNSNGTNKPNSSQDWEKIMKCLKEYSNDYANTSYKDTDTDGIYTNDYKNMLKSLYENGGFWIGRYEAGLEEGKQTRVKYEQLTEDDKAVIKPNMIPYNYVTKEDAQNLADRMNYENCTSSLIYGIQGDLVLKYIETKKKNTDSEIQAKLLHDSTKIGNYYDSEFILSRGLFAQHGALSNWFTYNSGEKSKLVAGSKKIKQSSNSDAILLTTGATEASNLQNMYDISGNVWEWSLEIYNSTSSPYTSRGGSYNTSGVTNPTNYRIHAGDNESGFSVGFRIGVWK